MPGRPEPGRDLAFVHDAADAEVGILGVVHDERAERPWHSSARWRISRALERLALAIGEGDRAGFFARRPISVISSPLRPLVSAASRVHMHDGLFRGRGAG